MLAPLRSDPPMVEVAGAPIPEGSNALVSVPTDPQGVSATLYREWWEQLSHRVAKPSLEEPLAGNRHEGFCGGWVG